MSKEKMLEVLEAEVGYLEKKSNSKLDDKTANAGYNNWTKYGVWYANDVAKNWSFANTYWCDMFISWGAKESNEKDAVGYFAYCPYHVQYFKNKGVWKTKNPLVGDIIFFQSNGVASHVGIVYKVSGNTVYTVEGNTSSGNNTVIANGGGVFKKSYTIGSSYILGYATPDYSKIVKDKGELTLTQYEEIMAILEPMKYQFEETFKTMAQIKQNASWAVETVQKLIDCGALQGEDSSGQLNMSYTMLRILVIFDRIGMFDNLGNKFLPEVKK